MSEQDQHGEPANPWTFSVHLRPANLLIFCLFVHGWFVILHLHLAEHPNPGAAVLGQSFDLLRESSLPTTWAVLQAVAVAGVAGLVALCLGAQGVPKNRRVGWVFASGLFALIAMDDAAGLHERLGAITSLELMTNLGYPSYPWHIVVAPIFAGLLMLVLYLLWADLGKVKGCRALVVAAVACFGFSQVIDFYEGIDRMSQGALIAIPKSLPAWMVVEEVVEMAGTALFLCAFVAVLKDRVQGLPLVVVAEAEPGKEVAAPPELAPVRAMGTNQ